MKKPYWFDVVTRPFAWNEIEIKVQSTNADKNKGTAATKALPVAYFDSRVVRRRLNEAFGPENWTAEHRELFAANGALLGVVCKLVCHAEDGEGKQITVVREEVGMPSSIEPVKGAYSDAIKRAFSALGNDWLYEITLGWYPYTGKTYAPFAQEWIAKMQAVYEEQIGRNSRENPMIVFGEPEAERPSKPDRGVEAVVKKATNGAAEPDAYNAEQFAEEQAELLGMAR